MIPRRLVFTLLLVFAISGVATAQSLSVPPSLSVSPSIVVAGEPVTVTWTAPPGSSTTDWVGLYHIGAANQDYLCVHFTFGAETGSFKCDEGISPGIYEFRYLVNDSYSSVASSNTFTVESTSGYTLLLSDNITYGGGPITVTWSAPADRPVTDWVGLFHHGDADNHNYDPVRWLFTNGAASGSQTFTMPMEPGQYVFRYLVRDSWLDVTESAVVTVSDFSIGLSAKWIYQGEPITATFNTPPNPGPLDWIGLYQVGDPDTAFKQFWMLNGASTGTITVNSFLPIGVYEFRLFTDNSYQRMAVSSVFSVYAPVGYNLQLSATTVAPGASVTVTWTAPAGRLPQDWISVFAVGADNHEYGSWVYTGGAETGSATLVMPMTPGVYEVRYLLNNGWNDVFRSVPINVVVD